MNSCIIFLCLSLITFTNAEWGWLPNERARMQGVIDLDDPTPASASTWNGATIGIASSQSQSRPSDIPVSMDTRHDQQYGADDMDDDDDIMKPEIPIYMEPYMEPETTSTHAPYISSTGGINPVVSSTAAAPTSEATPTPTPTTTPPLHVVTPADDPYTESFRQYVTHLHDMWCRWMPCDIPTSTSTTSSTTPSTPITPTTPITSTTPITPTTSITPTTPITPITHTPSIATTPTTPSTNIDSTIDTSDMDDVDTSDTINDSSYDPMYDDPAYDDIYDDHDEATFFPSTTSIPSVNDVQEDVNVSTSTTVPAYEPTDVAPTQSMTTTTIEFTDPSTLEITSFALDTDSTSDSFSSACSMIATQLSYTRWWLCFFSAIFCLLLLLLLRLEWMQQHEKDEEDMEMGDKEICIEKEMSPHYRLLHTQVTRGADIV